MEQKIKTEKVWSVKDAMMDIAGIMQPGDSIKVYGIGTDIITRIAMLNDESGEIGSYRIYVPHEVGKRMFPMEVLREEWIGRDLWVDQPHFGYKEEIVNVVEGADDIRMILDDGESEHYREFSDEDIWTLASGLSVVHRYQINDKYFEYKFWIK